MDFLQLQCDPRTDLISLKKHLDQGFGEEKQSYCKSLSNKYDQVSRWIKQKASIENPEMIDKDEIGQTLVPEDIILEDETCGFLACKATGDGDCLFHSVSRILVGDQSLSHFLRLLTTLELYINSDFYSQHSAFQEYLNAGIANSYDEQTLFTMCLTAGGMASWDGKDRIKAIRAEANSGCKERVWCGMFHAMALTSILGRPLYSVYPNVGSRIRDFLHRKILPRILNEGAQSTVYIMWSRDGSLDTTPGTWYEPNHFIAIFRVSHKPADSKSKTPGSSRSVANPKPSLIKKATTKGTITSYFSSEVGQHQKSIKRKRDEVKSPTYWDNSASVKKSKLGVTVDNSETLMKTDSAKTSSRKLTCATVEKWKGEDLADFQAELWLTYDSEKTGKGNYCSALKCKVCTQFEPMIKNRPKFSRVFIDGSTNFRLTSVIDHAKSDIHKIAFSLYNKQKGETSLAAEQNQQKLDFNLNSHQIEDLKKKFDISYFVVKEELPLSKYEKIIALEKRHGVPHGTVYSNRTAATEFISFQANDVLTKLSKDISQSKFYSVLFDSTTDNAVAEQEAVFVLYFDPAPSEPELSNDSEPMVKVKTGFLSIQNLRSSDAQGVLAALKMSLENLGLSQEGEIPPTLIGLGGDGCSTNRGQTSGVQALFKKEFPWSVFSWCVAHRLELALKDALSNTYFKEVDELLLRLYYLYENSPKRLRGLYELHTAYKQTFVFEEGSVKPKRATGTRWISHKLDALKILVDKFGLFIQHLETLSCDKSVKPTDQAKLKGYLRKWKSGKLFVYSCFFVDLLQPAAVLSQVFQVEDVDAVTVSLAISKAKKQLNNVQKKEVDKLQTLRHYLDKIDDDKYQGVELPNLETAMTNLKEHAPSFVQLLQNAIEIRLSGSNDIATMAEILNCEAWDCKSSGNESMDQVILGHLCHFQEPLRQQGLQASQIEVVNEWHDMLDYTVKYLSPSCHHYRATWFKIFHSSRSFQWQNILLLIRLLFSVPVSNAVLERFFSSLGRVKSVKRASLSQQTLEDILRIQAEGPPMESYDPTNAIKEWDRAKRRRPNQKRRKAYKKRVPTKRLHLNEDSSDERSSEESSEESLFKCDVSED